MADIATSILEVGSNRLILQDAEARTKINEAFVTDTASGSIASFPDGADGVPVKSLTVDIEPVQSGSGDPSPDNVRPISGHTSAVVTRTGANVWDEVWEVGGINQDGTNADANDIIRSKNYIPVVPNTSYYCTYGNGDKIYECFFYGSDKSHISNAVLPSTGVVTTPSNCGYMRFRCRASYGATYKNDISINYPATDTEYHAYQGQTVTIDLNGTRYGGTLDVTTGVLTVDRQIVDMGTLTWILNGGYFKSSSLDSIIKRPVSNTEVPQVICSIYVPVNWNTTADKSVNVLPTTGSAQNVFLWVKDSSYADAESFKTAMNGVQLCYTLAEPFTVQLTANEMSTVLGQNNIWNDCGDTEVEYRADTKLYIQKVMSS